MTTPRPDCACTDSTQCFHHAATPRPDALTAESEALLHAVDLEMTTWSMPYRQELLDDCRHRLAAIEAAARASLADEVREAERKRSDAERERDALREALEWAMARVLNERGQYSHPAECSPSECRCGYRKARAALAPTVAASAADDEPDAEAPR